MKRQAWVTSKRFERFKFVFGVSAFEIHKSIEQAALQKKEKKILDISRGLKMSSLRLTCEKGAFKSNSWCYLWKTIYIGTVCSKLFTAKNPCVCWQKMSLRFPSFSFPNQISFFSAELQILFMSLSHYSLSYYLCFHATLSTRGSV